MSPLQKAETMPLTPSGRRKPSKRAPYGAKEVVEFVQSENNLQAEVVRTLRPLEDAIGFRVVAIPNGGKRRPREAAQLKNRGVRAGFPDLAILQRSKSDHNGHLGTITIDAPRTILIELKTPQGVLSDEQVEWHAWLDDNMFCVYVCTSLASVLTVLRSHGLRV